MNALDRAILAMKNGPAGQPELFRRLPEVELWALMPWHPELEDGEFELKEGMPIPFAVVSDKEGQMVPIFSSEERLDEGLQCGKVPPRTYVAGMMPAKQLLQIVGRMNLHAVINYRCKTTGHVVIPPDLMRDLADGSALRPRRLNKEKTKESVVTFPNPADYPTAMVQPVFEILRRSRNFRAAWLVTVPEGKPIALGKRHYQLLVEMDPRDDELFHDLEIVLAAVPKDGNTIGAGLLNEKDRSAIEKLFRLTAPFFVAPDYQRPPGAKE